MYKSLILILIILTTTLSCATSIGKEFSGDPIEPYGLSEKLLIGVIVPNNKTNDPNVDEFTNSLSGQMIAQLQNDGRYRVVEKEKIDSIIKEQKFQLSGLVDSTRVQEFGKLLGVDAICITNIAGFQYEEDKLSALIAWINSQTVEVTADSRIVYVETGEVLTSASSEIKMGKKQWIALGFLRWGKKSEKEILIEDVLKESIKELSYKLSKKAPKK